MTDDQAGASRRNGILFLCTGNGARSQMAEALARFIGPTVYVYYSAGTSAVAEISPLAIKAMREIGVDISQQQTKTMDEIPLDSIASVVWLCDGEEEQPNLPDGVEFLPWRLSDPRIHDDSDIDELDAYRRVRDEIRELISRIF